MVPLAARDVAAVAGAVLVLSAVASVVGTVIVPRKTGSRLTRLVAAAVNGIFLLVTRPVASYRRRDRIMAGQAAVILLGQLAAWLFAFYVGYALLIWPVTAGIGTAFTSVGPALWTFGVPDPRGFYETAALDTAARAGLITTTLPIRYLPPLRPRLRPLHPWHPPRVLYAVGTLGGGRHGKPRDLLTAGLVPLAKLRGILGDLAARRARLCRALPLAVPGGGPRRAHPAVPARRARVLRRGRPLYRY